MALSSTFKFGGADLSFELSYNGTWGVTIEALGFRGEYIGGAKIARISLGNRTVGDVIETVYRLFDPGKAVQLPEPWNICRESPSME